MPEALDSGSPRIIAVGSLDAQLEVGALDVEALPIVQWRERLLREIGTEPADTPILAAVHSAWVDHLRGVRQRAREEALDRIVARSDFDRVHTATALARLIAAVNGSTADHLGEEATPHTTDELLAVVRLVGTELGARVVAPRPVIDGVPDVYTLDDIARASRLTWREVSLRGQWWRRDAGPLVATWARPEDNREPELEPVALLWRRRGYVLHTGSGEEHRLTPELAGQLETRAWSLHRRLPRTRLTWRDLAQMSVHGGRGDALRLLGVGLTGAALGLLTPAASQILFDLIIPSALHTELLLLVVLLVLAGFASLGFQFVRDLASMRLHVRADISLQTALWARILAFPAGFFRDYDAGDLADRITGLAAAQRELAGATLSTLTSSIFSLVSLGLMIFYAPGLAALVAFVTVVLAALILAAGYRRVRLERNIAELRGRGQGFVLQAVGAINKLRVARAERRAFARWAALFSRQRALQVRSRQIGNSILAIRQSLPLATAALVFWVTAQDQSTMSTGAFAGFLVASTQFMTAGLAVAGAIVDLTRVAPYYERARPLLDCVPELDERKPQLGDVQGHIELSHLSFRYQPELPLVVRDVSLTIRQGEFVAFVGRSGSGKSTLFRLLLGLESPSAGGIYIDGHDLAGLDIQSFRRQVGVVLQNSRVMAGSILSNIVSSSGASLEQAWEAARLAGLAEDIERMPMKMQTVVSAGGGTLSGGQRQRLLIARALVKRPRFVMFDEATSALDNHAQTIVSQSLERLQLTRVVIAHRLSTIRKADRIVVIDQGRIVQVGSFEQLHATPGPFADLAARQLL